MKGLLKIADCVFSTAAALAVAWSVLLTGCDMDSREGCSPYPCELDVTLPALTVADAVVVEPMGSRSAVSVEDDALFSVGLGPERGADASGERSLSTRADVTLSNVWVLQFDASGATKACAYVGTVAAGRKVQATLQSGENYTVWIVANGPAEGVLTTSNPATLSDFENKMLHTAAPASDETIPLTGGLSGVRILDNGQVLVGEDNTVVPEMTLTRAMARVDVLLEYDVDGAELDGVWLYQVPAGACYGLDDAVTDYPASGTVSNFAYRNGDTSGLVPTSSGSGTVTHTWYIGDNRRGQNPVIQWEKNKGSNNAPAMATYARIKSHESSDTAKGLFHDVYLGENVTTDFNVLRNRHYIYRVRIGGTLDDQKLLAERDDRVWAGTLEYLDGAPTVDPDLSLPIHVNGQTMRVTFSGYWTGPGIPVRATVVGGEELASGIAACYVGNTGSAMLEIPKNEGGAERQIEFAYEWKGEWNVIGIGTQAGYGVTGGTVTPEGDIPGQGGDYVVTLNGAWEDFVKVRAWDGSKSLVNVTVLTPGADVNFTVPANESFDSRTVTFQYQWGDDWITIGEPRTQASGASISSATVTPAGDIPAEGKTYSLTLTGTIPSAGVEVRAQSGGTTLVTGTVIASGTPIEMSIPANRQGAARTVIFEYNWNSEWTMIGNARWQGNTRIGEVYGGGVIYWVNPEDDNDFRVMALDMAPGMRWSENTAMILGAGARDNSKRNGADVWIIAQRYSDNKNNGASGHFATDFPAFSYCYEKTDGNAPKGTWYLPSSMEVLDLLAARETINSICHEPGFEKWGGEVIWSCLESTDWPNAAYARNPAIWLERDKNVTNHVRCVRSGNQRYGEKETRGEGNGK